jgi:hypothetical protein
MGESITTLKKQMEKCNKEFERIDTQTKQRNIDVDRKFEEVMNKLSQMTEVMMTLKNLQVSQPTTDTLGWDAEVEARKQQFVLQTAGGRIRK